MDEMTDDAVGDKGTREVLEDEMLVIGIQDDWFHGFCGGTRGGTKLYGCRGSGGFVEVAKTFVFSVSERTCPMEVDGGITNGISSEYLDL